MTSKWSFASTHAAKPSRHLSSSQTKSATTAALHMAGQSSSKTKSIQRLSLNQTVCPNKQTLSNGTATAQPWPGALLSEQARFFTLKTSFRKQGSRFASSWQLTPTPTQSPITRQKTSTPSSQKKSATTYPQKKSASTERFKTMFAFALHFEELYWTMSERPEVLEDLDLGPEEALRLLAYPPEDLEPEDALYRSEVARIVEELPPNTRTIAWLIGVEDKRQVDVAELLRVDQSTVSRRWKRALEQIERELS